MQSFHSWLDALFGAPLLSHPGDLCNYEILPSTREEELSFFSELFEFPSHVLAAYSADQVGQGLAYLVSGTYQTHPHVLLDRRLSTQVQQATILNIINVFREVFAIKTEQTHPEYAQSRSLDHICYVWWDVFPTEGAPDERLADHFELFLSVMEQTLYINSLACVESALHGLNHWVKHREKRVHTIIDTFLRHSFRLSLSIREHAQWAKDGLMQ